MSFSAFSVVLNIEFFPDKFAELVQGDLWANLTPKSRAIAAANKQAEFLILHLAAIRAATRQSLHIEVIILVGEMALDLSKLYR